MTFILETGQYFGTSQNGIEDKKNGTEGVVFSIFSTFDKNALREYINNFFIERCEIQ